MFPRLLLSVAVLLSLLPGLSDVPMWAQATVNLVDASGAVLAVTGKNASRGDDTLILYDVNYGPTTRTNPYGVELIAVPAGIKTNQYKVQAITSIWECQKQADESLCGNAVIPADGIVLSAAGNKRQPLLDHFRPGDTFELKQEWFQRTTAVVDAVNPSPLTNPKGSGFPGYRGGNQLVLYDAGYGATTTGTNEFGYEVTVRNGIVTDHEGSNSSIPSDGFVLSGHGRGKNWLIGNVPIGARVDLPEGAREVTSRVDFETYEYQLNRKLAESPCKSPEKSRKIGTCHMVERARHDAEKLYAEGQADAATGLMTQALEDLNRFIWTQYPAFPASAIKAAWHRPVEKNAAEVGQTLERLKKAGLNTVFLETYFHGYTIFPSETYRAYGLPAQNPKFAGVDLLKIWVSEAHARGMQVHPWFQTFYAGTNAYLPPGPILAKYPEWTNVQYSSLDLSKRAQVKLTSSTLELGGYFLDPANPEVQNFLTQLAEEIVTRYEVDGLQLDYIRYPASFPSDRFSYHKTTWGYTPIARAEFQAQYGIDPIDLDPRKDTVLWQDWGNYKAANVNRFVQRVSARLHQLRPNLKVSAAIFPEQEAALAQKHQDWRLWANSGWVDFLAPMTLTSAVKVVERDTDYVLKTVNYKVPVYAGVFGPFNNNTAETLLEQIDAARKAGAGGFSIFDTAHLTGRMLQALQAAQTVSKILPDEMREVEVAKPAQPAPTPATVKPARKRRWFLFGR